MIFDRREHALCVEPQSGPPDIFNGERFDVEPMVLRPGEALFALVHDRVEHPPMIEPASTRRINAASKLLSDPEESVRVLTRLTETELANIAELTRQLQSERAVARGDLDEIIAAGFERAFDGDELGCDPYVVGDTIVCPGSVVWRSRTSHTCRFVSVNRTWVWDCRS